MVHAGDGFWYKCEICDFTFWPGSDRTFRAQKQNSPRRCWTRSFSTLLAFTACLMAKHNGQRWTPREMEMQASLQRSILKSTFGSAGVGGQRDVEDREGEDVEEGDAGSELCIRTPKDRAAPKVSAGCFSPSLAGINIADAVSAVRSSPQTADRKWFFHSGIGHSRIRATMPTIQMFPI